MVSLTIDGKTVSVPAATTILEAARKLDIAIPTLCWLQKVSPTGACRICAVEVEGVDRPMTACNTPVKDGIVVTTQSDNLAVIRKQIVELLLVNHPLDCPVCDAGGECGLQDICYDLDVDRQHFEAEDVNPEAIDKWPLIRQVPNRCILCEKCVKVCHEVVGSSALFVNDSGERGFIDKHLDLCEFCGNCVQVCPTGTMISKPFRFRARPWEMTKFPSVCTTCSAHCEADFHVKNREVYRVTSEEGTTVNDGNLCIGGFFGHSYMNSPERLDHPQVREGGDLKAASWDEAMTAITEKFSELKPEQVAGLGSPRLTNEENYLFQRLFRAALGSNNIDSEARFGALKALQATEPSLGLRGASNRMDRIGKSDAVLVFGSDVTAEAPAIDWQIEKSCLTGHGSLLVANMRKVKLKRHANAFLNYRPGSEVPLANALARLILDKGLADEAFLDRYVANPEDLRSHLGGIDIEAACERSGIERADLEEAAELLGAAETVAVIFGGDVLRSADGVAKSTAVMNLALVSGALHGDIGGLFPIDEKGNIQGLLDMGVYPESLPGYRDYEDAGPFEKAWGKKLPQGGRDALGILEGIEKGEIRALYLAATNPLVSYPDSGRWLKALDKVEFLVVQDIFSSDLTHKAHVVLPGAAPVEKTGSVTSLDHRVSCLGKAYEPAGKAREDWDILADLYGRLDKSFDADRIIAEMKQLVPLYTEVCLPGEGRCEPCQKELYAPVDKGLTYIPAQDDGASNQQLTLLTGKILFQFGTMTTRSPATGEVAPEGYVAINSVDAENAGIADGEEIEVSSSTGTLRGKAKISNEVPAGLLFAPHHFAELNPNQVVAASDNQAAVEIKKI
ncbi:MAG: molybdopterin-dependent oxidoreductase [Desulfuromonadales bacterium]